MIAPECDHAAYSILRHCGRSEANAILDRGWGRAGQSGDEAALELIHCMVRVFVRPQELRQHEFLSLIQARARHESFGREQDRVSDESHGFKLFNDKIETPGDGLMIRGMQDRTAASINIVSANNFIRAGHSLYHSAVYLELVEYAGANLSAGGSDSRNVGFVMAPFARWPRATGLFTYAIGYRPSFAIAEGL